MGDSTHTMAVSGVSGQDTAQIRVPASVQREQGISIDDEIEVTVDGLEGLFNSVSFTGNQVAGDTVTVPAKVVRQSGIEHGERYEVMFEKVAEEPVDELEDEEYAIEAEEIDEETEKRAQEVVDEMEEMEQEEDLGQLFG